MNKIATHYIIIMSTTTLGTLVTLHLPHMSDTCGFHRHLHPQHIFQVSSHHNLITNQEDSIPITQVQKTHTHNLR